MELLVKITQHNSISGEYVKKRKASVSNYDLWMLMAEIHHDVLSVRQHELRPCGITPQQLQLLRIIHALGAHAKISEIAKKAGRKPDVISRQSASLEYDGLITREKEKPKSRLLKVELTKKGFKMLKICAESKSLDTIWSFLTEEKRQTVFSDLSEMLCKLKEYSPDKTEDD
jgi:DNA-binding MarR family transcriptional regulator